MPAVLSRSWYIEDDDNGEWNLNYYAAPKPLPRNNEYNSNHVSSKKVPSKIASKSHVDNPQPVIKPTRHSKITKQPPTPVPEDSIKEHHILSEDLSAEEQERQRRFDTQFGPIGSHDHRYVSKHVGGELAEHIVDEPPPFYILTTHIGYTILIAFGRVRDFFGIRFKRNAYRHITDANGYAALNSDWSNFYFRRLKLRMNDCFSRPYVTLRFCNSHHFPRIGCFGTSKRNSYLSI